tara:strand:+ start:904 stop:1101 length:198 start_codon:yes stop_codon:yes gene_type:complete
LKALRRKRTTIPKGIDKTKGLSGFKEKFCSSNILKKKVKNEGAYSELEISICEGVASIKKENKKM